MKYYQKQKQKQTKNGQHFMTRRLAARVKNKNFRASVLRDGKPGFHMIVTIAAIAEKSAQRS